MKNITILFIFQNDIIIHKLILTHEMFEHFPLPNGDYMFHARMAANRDWKALLKIYLTIDEFIFK